MHINAFVPFSGDIIKKNNYLNQFNRNVHPAEAAARLADMSASEIRQALLTFNPRERAEVFSHLEIDAQVNLAAELKRVELASLVSDMPPDDRVDLLKRIPEEQRENLLPAIAQAEREDIRRLFSYKEGTAGSVMTSEYATLSPELTVQEAIAKLRREAPDKETIYYAYVVDETRKLLGFISLKELILASPNTRVSRIMHRNVIFAKAEDDQEQAARIIQKYDFLALPVVNADNALVGIITHDDAMDIITQEQTEDLEKLMAIGGSHEAGAYLRTSSWVHFKNRAFWVISLAAMGLVSGAIIHGYESTLMNFIILALYMPMLADAGGNTGSQAATVVVRALALKEIIFRDIFRVLFKELKISIMLAIVLGILAWGKVMFLSRGADIPTGFSLPLIGLAIATALGLQVVTATLIGALLPIGASKLKLDPAVVASPALTTAVDITGLVIYFSTIKMILGI